MFQTESQKHHISVNVYNIKLHRSSINTKKMPTFVDKSQKQFTQCTSTVFSSVYWWHFSTLKITTLHHCLHFHNYDKNWRPVYFKIFIQISFSSLCLWIFLATVDLVATLVTEKRCLYCNIKSHFQHISVLAHNIVFAIQLPDSKLAQH